MNKIQTIQYKVENWDSSYGNTRLEIKIKGDDIDNVIVNTLRRMIFTNVPIYAFSEFNFKKNTTIYNNNYIKLRIKNIPIWGIENKVDIYTSQKKKNIDTIYEEDAINDDVDLDIETDNVNSSTLKQFTMFIDYTSTHKNIVTVTTDDAQFYYNEQRIDCPYKTQIPLIKLQPAQTITFSAISRLGIEKENAIFSPVAVCFYKEITPNEFIFCIESKGQLTETRIIEVAIINLIDKLKKIPNILESLEIDNNKLLGEIILLKEDNTIGNLLTTGLQKHKNIKFAGYNIPHLLEEKVIIHYEIDGKKDLKTIMKEVIFYYIELFKQINEYNKKLVLN